MSAKPHDQSRKDAAASDDRAAREAHPSALLAGRVGRAHGLDGSFYVTGAKPRLLLLGATLKVDGREAKIVRRAGTDQHPFIRLQDIEDRDAAEALRGLELTIDFAEAPELEEGEWWASELEGCEVFDGERRVGTVLRLVELPSCEALQVRLDRSSQREGSEKASELLVPMVRDAILKVDPAARRIDVDMSFLKELL